MRDLWAKLSSIPRAWRLRCRFPRKTGELTKNLGQILGWVSSVRTRLNSLALQHAVFYTLAIVSCVLCGGLCSVRSCCRRWFSCLVGCVLAIIAVAGI